MKYSVAVIILLSLSTACTKQLKLSDEFDCSIVELQNTIEKKDFKKYFSLYIPNNWKTNLYFTEYQSSIIVADTTEQLTETFILDASFNVGKLYFNTDFYKKTDSVAKQNNLEIVSSGNETFQSKPAYWYLTKGFKRGFEYHRINFMLILSEESYFYAYAEIYGDQAVNERICESISIIEKIKFLE